MNFSDILRALRTQCGLTQKQLGNKLNLTVSTVCDWEKQRSEPNISQLKALAAVFGLTVDFLIGNADEA